MLVIDFSSVVSNTSFPTDSLRLIAFAFRSPPAWHVSVLKFPVVVGSGVGGGKGELFLFILSKIVVPYYNARESQVERKKYVSTLKNMTFGPVGGLLSS